MTLRGGGERLTTLIEGGYRCSGNGVALWAMVGEGLLRNCLDIGTGVEKGKTVDS